MARWVPTDSEGVDARGDWVRAAGLLVTGSHFRQSGACLHQGEAEQVQALPTVGLRRLVIIGGHADAPDPVQGAGFDQHSCTSAFTERLPEERRGRLGSDFGIADSL